MLMTVGQKHIGVDNIVIPHYNCSMIRTYEMYAGDLFLGYEYGETEDAVLFRTLGKFGHPSKWGVDEFKANKILYREEAECKT